MGPQANQVFIVLCVDSVQLHQKDLFEGRAENEQARVIKQDLAVLIDKSRRPKASGHVVQPVDLQRVIHRSTGHGFA
jgi:hypothetical protein